MAMRPGRRLQPLALLPTCSSRHCEAIGCSERRTGAIRSARSSRWEQCIQRGLESRHLGGFRLFTRSNACNTVTSLDQINADLRTKWQLGLCCINAQETLIFFTKCASDCLPMHALQHRYSFFAAANAMQTNLDIPPLHDMTQRQQN